MKKLSTLFLFCLFVSVLSFGQTYYGTVTITQLAAPCDTNGILVAHISGGSSPFHVNWSGGPFLTKTDTVYGSTDTLRNYSGSFVNVNAWSSGGTYLDTGTFAGDPPFSFSFPSVPAVCADSFSISVTVAGGAPPYSYQWYVDYGGTVIGTTNPITVASGMAYGVTIIDAGGCMYGSAYSFWLVDTVMSTPNFTLSTFTSDASCNNGAAGVHISGGTAVPPLSYLWSNGATTDSISGLISGAYNIVVTDSTGCSNTQYTYVSETPGYAPMIYLTPTPPTCLSNDGAAIAFGAGGVTPYTYLWSTGATTQSVSGLIAGNYEINVTDSRGCSNSMPFTLSPSTPISVTYSTLPSSCVSPTGSVTLNITGGTPPYADTFFTSPIQTGPTASGLAAGSYYFRVVDHVGCVQYGTVVIPPIDVMTTSFVANSALCATATGSLTVSVTGGVAPLSYLWSTGGTGPVISGEPYGWYAVTITDANGCIKTCGWDIPSYSPVTVGFSDVPASCIYVSDATDTAVVSGGTPPYTYVWNTGASTSYLTGIPTGSYTVAVTDASGCEAWNVNYVGYNVYDSSCFCLVSGVVYQDLSGSCTYNSSYPRLNHMQLSLSGGVGSTWTNDTGFYYFLAPAGIDTLSEVIETYYPLSVCQANHIPLVISPATGCTINENFANTIDTIHSIYVSTWDYLKPVPGEGYTQYMIVENQGTVTEPNILAGYKTDGQLLSASFVPTGIMGADSTNWYNNPGDTGISLAPGAAMAFYINYTVPTYVPLGTNVVFKDSASYSAPMINWLVDYSPWDNVNYFTTTVVGSFDPNFKEVNPKGYGAEGVITTADSNLEYMVHFQNTGTAPAINIIVVDTLDPHLNWATMAPVYESAPCKISMSPAGVLTYAFYNINLPPNGVYTAITSNGMFTYNIRLNPDLPIGTQIKNKASIFFDYNAPIVTNTTLNTIGWPLETGTVEVKPDNIFKIYPNPAGNSCTLAIFSEKQCSATVSVSDITGRDIENKIVSLQQGSQAFTLNTISYPIGVYFVTVSESTKTQTQKMVILK